MKTLPTQSRALAKRRSLINAAVDTFSQVGYEAATAKSIAAAAGVATGTFYQYFENKSDILSVIAAERSEFLQQHINVLDLQVVDGASNSIVENKIEEILRFVYEFHLSATELHQVLEQRRATDDSLRQIMAEGEAVIKERLLSFVKSFNRPHAKVVSDNLFAMGEGIVHRLVFEGDGGNPELALQIGAKMIASHFTYQ